MSDLDNDDRVTLLVALIDRLFGPEGLCALAPAQYALLRHFRDGPLDVEQAAERTGAHAAIVKRAFLSLERKGLLVLVETDRDGRVGARSGGDHDRYRLTAIAHVLFDPSAARQLAPMLAKRRVADPSSLDEMVAALLDELPPEAML